MICQEMGGQQYLDGGSGYVRVPQKLEHPSSQYESIPTRRKAQTKASRRRCATNDSCSGGLNPTEPN